VSELPELYWSPEHGLILRTHPDSLGGGRYIAAEYRSGRYLNDGLPADAVPLAAAGPDRCDQTRVSTQWGRVRCCYPAGHVARLCEYIHPGGGRLAWRTGSPEHDDPTRCHRFINGDHGFVEVCGLPVNAESDTCAAGHSPTAADYRNLASMVLSSGGRPELPLIPGHFKLQRDKITFVTFQETWHLIGPASMLPVGQRVFVDRFSDDTNQEVLVGVHVAERAVRHADGQTVHYAIALIDRGDQRR
jgi:hypothetical protein